MNFSKRFALLIIFLLNLTFVNAQTNDDYAAQWKKIAAFEAKGLSKNALEETVKIFTDAVKKGNEAQQIKAAMYQMKYRNMVEEDNAQKNIFFVDTLIAQTKPPAKNILLSMQAQLFQSYKENNRYKLYGRTALVEEIGNDLTTWSIKKLNEKISSLYKASLQNENILKATELKGLDAIIEKGVNSRQLRPTLYDLLAHRALDYFMSSENDVTQPAYKFIINDPVAFAPVKEFAAHRFVTKDTASLYYNALLIMQDLLSFHANDANPEALIDADLKRLEFINEHGSFTDKQKLYEAALLNLETRYSSSPASAQAAYLRARLHLEKAEKYNPLTGAIFQFEKIKAKEIAEAAYAKFPKSEGGINAKNLLLEIEKPEMRFETEKVNLPEQPFRALVQYKNINEIWLRLVKTNRDEIKRSEQTEYDKIWPAILSLKAMKTWSVALPDQKDYQEHTTEIKIDGLPLGTYYLIASKNEDFSLGNNIIARAVTFVSNISYIANSKNELYALDRNDGKPLVNATVQLWANEYNYGTRKYEENKRGLYTTDKNGFVKNK